MKERILIPTAVLTLSMLFLPGHVLAAETLPQETILSNQTETQPAVPETQPKVPEKQPGTASVFQPSLVYGEPVAPAVSSETNDTEPELFYKIQGSSDDTYTPEAPTAAGVYTVLVLYPESESYLEAAATADFAIRARISAVFLDENYVLPPKTYDGTPEGTGRIAPPLTFTVEGSGQQPQLGQDYEVLSVRYLSPLTDQDPDSKNAVIRIGMKDGMFAMDPALSTEFSLHGDIRKAKLTLSARDQVTLEGFEDSLSQISAQGLARGDALAAVSISLNGDDKLLPRDARIENDQQDVTAQYEIVYTEGKLSHRAEVARPPQGAENLFYNGQSQPLLKDPGQALQGSLLYQLSYQASQTGNQELLSDWSEEAPTGTLPGIYTIAYKARNTLLLADLPDSGEHSLTVILAPKVLEITADAQKIYDGSESADNAVLSAQIPEEQIIPGDQVWVTAITGSSFPTAHAGTGHRMQPGNVVLDGRDAGSYTVKLTDFTGTIAPRAVTVTASDLSKSYGQQDPEFSYEVQDLVEGDSLTGSLQRVAGENAGRYKITAGTLDESHNPDYRITFIPGVLEITPAQVELKLEFSRKTARAGKPLTVTVTARNPGQNLLPDHWAQPGNLSLSMEGKALEPIYQGGGQWLAQAEVDKNPPDRLSFHAEVEDPSGNYRSASLDTKIRTARFGANPLTGDQILAYGTLAVLSFLALSGLIAFYVKKKK